MSASSPSIMRPVIDELIDQERIGTIVKIPSGGITVVNEGGLPRYKLRRVIEYIQSKMSGSISLEDLAGAAGMSRFHFHRQFKKAVGMTPHHYILQLRIERAKALLVDSNLAVGEVAGAVGFVDQSHFSNIFRKFTAVTPRNYRNCMSR